MKKGYSNEQNNKVDEFGRDGYLRAVMAVVVGLVMTVDYRGHHRHHDHGSNH